MGESDLSFNFEIFIKTQVKGILTLHVIK